MRIQSIEPKAQVGRGNKSNPNFKGQLSPEIIKVYDKAIVSIANSSKTPEAVKQMLANSLLNSFSNFQSWFKTFGNDSLLLKKSGLHVFLDNEMMSVPVCMLKEYKKGELQIPQPAAEISDLLVGVTEKKCSEALKTFFNMMLHNGDSAKINIEKCISSAGLSPKVLDMDDII